MPVHIEPDIPDVPAPQPKRVLLGPGISNHPTILPEAFARAVDDATASLEGAQGAEDRFADGAGSLEDAVYERARADIALSVATAATGRVLQSVQSLLNMQV